MSYEQAKEQVAVKASGPILNTKIYSPFKTYFDGDAKSVSAVNKTGPFDILPQHHKFITLLSKGDIVVRNDKGAVTIPIERGIMQVSEDQVKVYLDF